MTKSANFLIFVAGLLVVSCEESKQRAYSKALPNEQTQFSELVESYFKTYQDSSNELKKSALRTERGKALAKVIPNLQVSSWIGTVDEMKTTSEGDAVLSIQLHGYPIRVKTWNNSFSDIASGTLIKHGSDLYNQVASLSKLAIWFLSVENSLVITGIMSRKRV